jgi:hypothetical protein
MLHYPLFSAAGEKIECFREQRHRLAKRASESREVRTPEHAARSVGIDHATDLSVKVPEWVSLD